MPSEAEHADLATIRDLVAMPLAALVVFLGIGGITWVAWGSTSAGISPDDSYCGGGLTLLFYAGVAVWFGAILGAILLAKPRGSGARVLITLWNGIVTAPLLLFVYVWFAVGVASCTE
jgi:hypothetical protein